MTPPVPAFEDLIDPNARPRLRPEALVLSRGASEFQIGVDENSSLLVPDREGRLQTVLRRLDGTRTWSTILAEAGEHLLDSAELSGTLQTLAAAGLVDIDRQPGASSARVGQIRLVGLGVLGTAIGELLLRNGVEGLHVVDGSPAEPDPASSGLPGAAALTRAEAFRRRCRERGFGNWAGTGIGRDPVRVATHWTKPEAAEIQLTVLAASGLEADRGAPADLLRRDAPHLVVRPAVSGAVVGPLVVPGRSSCLHCADLTRRDADPVWPRLLSQLGRRTVPVPPAILAWAAGVTVAQVLSFVNGGRPETLGATLEIATPTYAMLLRAWPLHPECGCHWNENGSERWDTSRSAARDAS